MALDFDVIHWELDDNDDVMPREEPLVVPNAPSISSIEVLGTTSVRLTVASDDGVTNTPYYMEYGDDEWTAGGNTVVGSGTVDVEDLSPATQYWFQVRSANEGFEGPPSPTFGPLTVPNTVGADPVYTQEVGITPNYVEV